jgi:protein SCO1/2
MAAPQLTETNPVSSKRIFPIGTVVLFLAWLVLMAIALVWWRPEGKELSPELRALLWPQPRPLQPFALVDQHKAAFSEPRLHGHWTFVFFGYTHCPDICPTSMLTLKQVSNLLEDDLETATDVQFAFVSVDPDRDPPEVLKSYIAYFDQAFIGATGEKSEIDRFAMQFGAGYVKEPESDRDAYLISHTASFFLVDPKGRIVAVFSPPHDPDAIASLFKEIRGLY